jgi:23S rRNA pseudouridine955/2504/2580 synthase
MSGAQKLEVSEHEDGMRLNRWVKVHFPALRHGDLQKLLRTGQIRVDGGRAKANARLENGQIIRMPPALAGDLEGRRQGQVSKLSQADIEFVHSLVLYQDASLIAFNKPAGLAVQGGSKTFRHMDGLMEAFQSRDGERPRLVHRLDKDTSGVLIAAKTREAAAKLTKAFKARETQKVYWALVSGIPRPALGSIKLPLEKKLLGGVEKVVALGRGNPNGQRALTHFTTVSVAGRTLSWLQMVPVTGRKHQLRVHLAAIGHPVIGDGKYGGEEAQPTGNLSRKLHLHARSLKIPHPDGGMFEIEAPLEGHIADSWKFLGFDEREAVDLPLEPES